MTNKLLEKLDKEIIEAPRQESFRERVRGIFGKASANTKGETAWEV